jgi:Protein of unknown function (DUF3040)
MSLPASQQRVLDSMENRLRAGEPHLASMFGIFARLNAGEPVSAERLASGPRWRRPPGAALYAVVVFPLIFGLVIIGALLSGGAHGTGTCDVGYSIGGGTVPAGRSQCQTASQPASGSGAVSPAGPGPAGASCPRAAAPASQYTVRTSGDLALPPSAGASPGPGDTSGMC